ncbi:hypothetical protein [Treponema sp.]|uniref:hypothetical protein n=1 Tax=Treponema sp. TaxID=166 RepID=UPI0025FA6ED6|nr:hypothetical protein [Treponema sp.]MCR5218486.1 hypothetical protein [Treponema sp.]
MFRKLFAISVLILTPLLLLSCNKNNKKSSVITVDDFSTAWLKGSWDAEISETKGIYQVNRNFTVTVDSEDKVEIVRQSGSKESTDMDGLRDEVFYYYVSDVPSPEDIKKLEYDGLKIEGDALLYLNPSKTKITSEIKITELDGRTEFYSFSMTKK